MGQAACDRSTDFGDDATPTHAQVRLLVDAGLSLGGSVV